MVNLRELFNFSAEQVKYNVRIKSHICDGQKLPYEVMVCDRFIFNPDGVMRSDYARRLDRLAEYRAAHEEIYGLTYGDVSHYKPEPGSDVERAKRRAKAAIKDLILCNDFDCFVTLTLDAAQIDRDDYGAVMKKLNRYLDNRVRRHGLIYLGVAELHKKGGIHYHLLCNSEALQLVDSGTVSCKGHKKPIKVATADRYGIPAADRHTVYNVQDWRLGFSTAIMTYGPRAAVANYIGKYIAKGCKVGGRWYYSGGKLCRPIVEYARCSFDSYDTMTYDFDCDGGRFKVALIDDNGVIK